jgi:hypothetical protein
VPGRLVQGCAVLAAGVEGRQLVTGSAGVGLGRPPAVRSQSANLAKLQVEALALPPSSPRHLGDLLLGSFQTACNAVKLG